MAERELTPEEAIEQLRQELALARAFGNACYLAAFPAKSPAIVVPTRRADCDARSACGGLDPLRPFGEVPFAVVDCETTGTEPTTDRVVELAVVHSDGRTFSSLCNPGVPIPPGASAVHGIYDADVASAPTFAEAWDKARALLDGAMPLGYTATFDQSMVCAELARAGRDVEAQALADAEWIDAYVVVRDVDKYEKGKKLVEACARRGIQIVGAHRALADAHATRQLWSHIAPADCQARRLVDVLRMQRDRRAAQDADFAAWQARQARSGRAA